MKIAVCVKQVPRLDRVEFHPKTNRIVREGIEAMVNPLDLQALGHAVALREARGGEIVAISMGPPEAVEALEEALARGADRALHLVDKRFAGADTLATARALAHALEREEPDLLLFGRSIVDGATAQVGAQVAELLGLPQLTQVVELEARDGGVVRAARETERGIETWAARLPVAVTVERGPDPPEATAKGDGAAEQIEAETLGGGPRDYGTRGSKTYVTAVNAISLEREVERVEGVAAGAERLLRLVADRVHGAPSAPAVPIPRTWGARGRSGYWPSATGTASTRSASKAWPAPARRPATSTPRWSRCSPSPTRATFRPSSPPRRGPGHRPPRPGARRVRHRALGRRSLSRHRGAQALRGDRPLDRAGAEAEARVAARLGLGLTGDFVGLEVEDPDEDRWRSSSRGWSAPPERWSARGTSATSTTTRC